MDSVISKLLFCQEQESGMEEEDSMLLTDLDDCELYQDRINESLHSLVRPVPADPPVLLNNDPLPRSMLKSPTAPLPTFRSEPGENFELFIHNFEDTISKYNYAAYDKFLLLKSQISGKALYLIDSLEPTRQTYDQAKQLLQQALASREMQINNIMGQLVDMKLTYSGEPFKYIADMRKIVHSCDDLKITVNDILQYFFLRGMNDSFKNQLVLVTNSSSPTLDQILDIFSLQAIGMQ